MLHQGATVYSLTRERYTSRDTPELPLKSWASAMEVRRAPTWPSHLSPVLEHEASRCQRETIALAKRLGRFVLVGVCGLLVLTFTRIAIHYSHDTTTGAQQIGTRIMNPLAATVCLDWA